MQFTKGLSAMALWVVVPMCADGSSSYDTSSGFSNRASPPSRSPDDSDPWLRWHHLRSMCDHSTQVALLLAGR